MRRSMGELKVHEMGGIGGPHLEENGKFMPGIQEMSTLGKKMHRRASECPWARKRKRRSEDEMGQVPCLFLQRAREFFPKLAKDSYQ